VTCDHGKHFFWSRSGARSCERWRERDRGTRDQVECKVQERNAAATCSSSSSSSSSSSPLQMKRHLLLCARGAFTNEWPKERKARLPTQALPPALQQLPPPSARLLRHHPQAAPPPLPPLLPPPPVLHKPSHRSLSFPHPSLARRPEALWSPCIPVATSPSFVRCRLQVRLCAHGCRLLQATLAFLDPFYPFSADWWMLWCWIVWRNAQSNQQ